MENKTADSLPGFLELLNLYPSPHNGQPIRLKKLDGQKFEVYFQRERGLQAVDISYIFSFVSMGVFLEFATACAGALGHTLDYKLELPAEQDLHGTGDVKIAEMTIIWNAARPNFELESAIRFRQTSRKKYAAGLEDGLAVSIKNIAAQAGMNLTELSDQQAKQAIWLNQRAVFDDMFDPAVNHELNHWLRYSRAEKESKMDGLAYDCMELNGRVMNYIVHHPKILRAPVIAPMIKQYYLRTMSDSSDVFYMLAPFKTERQAFVVGTVISKIWIALSMHKYYLHPFGTIMSNHAAHRDFSALAGIQNESRESNYLVFIFRAGKSAVPVRSLRIPYEQHLIKE